jgi:membrane protease YdiL (CAAX protease family)
MDGDAEGRWGGREPDAGSRRAGLLALLVLIPVLAGVVLLQQLSVSAGSARAEASARETVSPPSVGDSFGLVSKLVVKFEALLRSESGRTLNTGQFMETVDTAAASPAEKLRAAIVAGELLGPEAARERLIGAGEAVAEAALHPAGYSAEASGLLLGDIEALDRWYGGEPLDDAERAGLVERHGWFGELALVREGTVSERAAVTSGGLGLAVMLGGVGLAVVGAFVAGLVLLVIGIVLAGTGRLRARFVPPAPGGSVYLETFLVFVLGFLVLQVVGEGLSLVLSEPDAVVASLALQWVLVLTAGWPLVRGVRVRAWREQLGLVAPRGVVREVGAGVLGYLAGVPVYVLAAVSVVVLAIVRELIVGALRGPGESAPVLGPSGPVNPVFELVGSMGVVGLVLLGSLVVLWAPLVEETILRGALYRHLRGRLRRVVSMVLSAVLFGLLHQYDVLLLLPVIALGCVFAAVREWRGSLIGCITGHMLHNTTVFGLALLVMWLVG